MPPIFFFLLRLPWILLVWPDDEKLFRLETNKWKVYACRILLLSSLCVSFRAVFRQHHDHRGNVCYCHGGCAPISPSWPQWREHAKMGVYTCNFWNIMEFLKFFPDIESQILYIYFSQSHFVCHFKCYFSFIKSFFLYCVFLLLLLGYFSLLFFHFFTC